jgi:hypothetical protein
MARRITGGLVGSSTLLGTIQISPEAAMATAADQDITFSPGAGGRVVSTANFQLNAQTDLRFGDADSSNWVAFQAPAIISSNVTWTLPATDGTSDQVLTTDASGILNWTSKSVIISDQTASATIHYPLFTTSTSGSASSVNVSTTKMTYQPSTGTFTVTNITESSSITLKENFAPIEHALEKLLQLSGWIYDRIDGTSKGEAGLIAEDVDKIIPNVVTKNAQGNPETIAYTRLSAYLIEAIKTLHQEIINIKSVK